MKPTLVPGIAHKRSVIVDRAPTIDFMGEELRVYATLETVRDIEVTAGELLLRHNESGEDSVGTRVEIERTGATPLGMPVEISVTVTEVKGRSMTVDVRGCDSVEEVGRSRHTGFIADITKTAQRLADKAARPRRGTKLDRLRPAGEPPPGEKPYSAAATNIP